MAEKTEQTTQIRLRPYSDWTNNSSAFKKGYITLPNPEEKSDNGMPLPVPLCSLDCSDMDLSMYDNNAIDFDFKTIFPKDPKRMIKDFNPDEIMERHKNPGLGIRSLHQEGFTGKGLSVAIIDSLLTPHQEYMDNLVSYKEFGFDEKSEVDSRHGPAVASLLIGKTCGVAPGAKLYYYAAKHNYNDRMIAENYTKALNDILNLNEQLPNAEKIQAVSISWGGINKVDGSDRWNETIAKAKKTGLYVISCNFDHPIDLFGLGRKNNENPDDANSYGRGYFMQNIRPRQLGIPMDNRSFASSQSFNGYLHTYRGGWSWVIPFYTGLFLLARQVNRNITLEEFHQRALDTALKRNDCPVPIVQPKQLIMDVQKRAKEEINFAINKFKDKAFNR